MNLLEVPAGTGPITGAGVPLHCQRHGVPTDWAAQGHADLPDLVAASGRQGGPNRMPKAAPYRQKNDGSDGEDARPPFPPTCAAPLAELLGLNLAPLGSQAAGRFGRIDSLLRQLRRNPRTAEDSRSLGWPCAGPPANQEDCRMARPVTLFTGQPADLPARRPGPQG